jgi:hypothetical protein
MLEEIPVCSQCVLTGTIKYEKNLKAIGSKILAQIVSKIGGVPWAIENLPLMEKRTMICGLDIYHHRSEENQSAADISVMGLVSSYNKTGTKYWSSSDFVPTSQETCTSALKTQMQSALLHFKDCNGCFPDRVVLYRKEVFGRTVNPNESAKKEVEQIL